MRPSFVLVVGFACTIFAMMPTFANTVSVQSVGADRQTVTVSNSALPVEVPFLLQNAMQATNIVTRSSSPFSASVDPGNDSAKCTVAKPQMTGARGPSAVLVTASAFGSCVVNVVESQGARQSFTLTVVQAIPPTPSPAPYVAKIDYGNNQSAVWPANRNIQYGDNAYFSAMEVQITDRAGNPVQGMEVDWECGMPSPMNCQMKLPMIMGILGRMGEMTHTDASGKADLPAMVLAPNGTASPLIANNGRGTFTVTADSPKSLFAPVVFTMTVK